MTTIGDRVKEAIDFMNKGQFVSDYMWLITYMGLSTGSSNIMINAIKVKFSHPDIKNDTAGYCKIEDIVYHVMRCGLLHSTGLDSKIQWSENISLGIDIYGNLIISNKFIWGLIGAVIFCPKNHDESIDKTYWISIDNFKFFIQEAWGRVDLAKRVINIKMSPSNSMYKV